LVSDQQLARSLDGHGGVPFTRIPNSPSTRDEAETRLLRLITAMRVTVVVLARYTPALSTTLLAKLRRLGVAVLTLEAGDRTQLAGSHYAVATVRLFDDAGDHILDQRFWRRPNNPTAADETRLERRGGQLLAETLAAWLDGRVLVTETTAEIL
jgi:formyltetrahydrofolate deformylase